MKKLIFPAILVLVLALAACGGGGTTDIFTGPPTSDAHVWKESDGSQYTGSGNVIDRDSNRLGTITGGKLTLSLPIPKIGDLEVVTSVFNYLSGVSVTPTSAKVYAPDLYLDLPPAGFHAGEEAQIRYFFTDGETTASAIMYLYSDSNLTVTGTDTNGSGTTFNYTLSLTPGWNQVWYQMDLVSENLKSDLTGFPKDSAKWYIDDEDDE
ncbi:MAG: hypothetical protein LBU17_10535 [Treponema sp.]|nr:hypothetical protein [Treponema sp.]